MIPALPEEFISRMMNDLGGEYPAFERELEGNPHRGIRFHPSRSIRHIPETEVLDPIPWEKNGRYLAFESDAGSGVEHEAGLYYIQEPSAMIPVNVLDPKPGERVLDLCAAPGGKSTQIAEMMKGEGLLVSNEIVPSRAQILSRNMERIGVENAVVISSGPEKLAVLWPGFFDAVLVDAPCSGEGMFRRDPATRSEWSSEKARGCSERQKVILDAASLLVRPGGRIVYSTCTFNPDENRLVVDHFLKHHPEFDPEEFALPGISGEEGMFTCYPHLIKGEGQFVSLLRKTDGYLDRGHVSLFDGDQPGLKEYAALPDWMRPSKGNIIRMAAKYVIIPDDLPDLSSVRVLRLGIHAGEIRGKLFIPDHAVSRTRIADHLPSRDLKDTEALDYLEGQQLYASGNGWIVMRWHGLSLGWGKGNGDVIKNHYPKGLRTNRLHV